MLSAFQCLFNFYFIFDYTVAKGKYDAIHHIKIGYCNISVFIFNCVYTAQLILILEF